MDGEEEGGAAVEPDIYWWMPCDVEQLNQFLAEVARDELIEFSKSADGVVDGHITAQLWGQVMKMNGLKEVASTDVSSSYELNQDWIWHCMNWEPGQGDFPICSDG